MKLETFVGPALIVYLISVTVGGVWWASNLSARVTETERQVGSAATASERIARLETLVLRVDQQLNRIEDKLDRRTRP